MKPTGKFVCLVFGLATCGIGWQMITTAQAGLIFEPYAWIFSWFGVLFLTGHALDSIDRSPGDGLNPSKIIGVDYLWRWHIIPRNNWMNIYLHKFLGSDDDSALHDHPFWSFSIRLRGEAWEAYLREDEVAGIPTFRTVWRKLPRFAFRPANFAHRIHLPAGNSPVWTIFITGKRNRGNSWGFRCKDGSWHHWTEFTNSRGDRLGGCGETWGDIEQPAINDL